MPQQWRRRLAAFLRPRDPQRSPVVLRPRGGGVLVASRIHLPESAAASFRLDGVERALASRRTPVRVLTTTPPPPSTQTPREATPPSGGSNASAASGRAATQTAVPSTQPSPAPCATREAGAHADPEGVAVSRWPALRDSTGALRGYLPYMSFDVPLAARLALTPRPDVALIEPPPTTGVVARTVLAARRIPYVWYAPDIWSQASRSVGAHPAVVRVVEWMEAYAMRGAQAVVAINEDVAEHARRLGARRVEVIPNGINTDVFRPDVLLPSAQERAQLGIDGPYLIYAGTASEWQGADIFLHALARVRDAQTGEGSTSSAPTPGAASGTSADVPAGMAGTQLPHILFMGQGSQWEQLRALSRELGLAQYVHFAPLAPAQEAARWQAGACAALVSLAPGLGYDFAFPTKILSALACGTPVIFAGPGPARELISAENLGWSCEYDADGVAHAMREASRLCVVETSETAAERQRRSRWVVKNRSLRRSGDEVAQLLYRVAQGATPRRSRRALPAAPAGPHTREEQP